MEVPQQLAFLKKRELTMTKRFITNLFFGVLIFGTITAIAAAQEEIVPPVERADALNERLDEVASRTDERREAMEERQENIASNTQAIRENIAERRGALSERVGNRILALANNVSEKMRAALYRLGQIADRMDSRMDTLEAEGKDMTAARAKVEAARGHLSAADALVNGEIDRLVDQTVGSLQPQTDWRTAREAFAKARQELKQARLSLVEALQLMKNAGTATPEETASATPNQ